MNVLVVGSGGREHALCWALAASPLVDELFCAPGNGGIAQVAKCIDIDPLDVSALIGLCRAESVDFVVVGPEAPLVAGIVDDMEAAGIKTFGPTAAAAVLEGSKGFTKDLCAKYGIPTAAYKRFVQGETKAAKAYIAERGAPIVVKADGLAAGKGVIVARTSDEANRAVDDILGGQFGEAGAELVIEDFLVGEEASFFVLCDGENILTLASAQDHKAVGEGDTGPNTGGMGAYSPAPVVSEEVSEKILSKIIRPTVAAMRTEGRPYKGVLFAGLMIVGGEPQLIEYNIRFGDPECQVLIARLADDILPALIASRDGTLPDAHLSWRDKTALVVVMAAKGYPGSYEKGSEIFNLNAAADLPDVIVFHAGTIAADNKIYSSGGRVLGLTALGDNVVQARAKAYEAVDVIDWPEGFCRRDIGWRALGR